MVTQNNEIITGQICPIARDSMKDFGSIIKELRNKNNLTQAKLAELVDYSEKELQRIEQNKHIPSVNLLHQLSRVFNMDLNEYYKRYYSNLSLEANQYYNEINSILNNLNYDALPAILDQCERLVEFKQDENKMLAMLGRAIFKKTIYKQKILRKKEYSFQLAIIF